MTLFSASYIAGVGISLFLKVSGAISWMLVITGILRLLSSPFAARVCALRDKTKGIGAAHAIVIALFLHPVIRWTGDGFHFSFSDYPIDKPLLGMMAFQPS